MYTPPIFEPTCLENSRDSASFPIVIHTETRDWMRGELSEVATILVSDSRVYTFRLEDFDSPAEFTQAVLEAFEDDKVIIHA